MIGDGSSTSLLMSISAGSAHFSLASLSISWRASDFCKLERISADDFPVNGSAVGKTAVSDAVCGGIVSECASKRSIRGLLYGELLVVGRKGDSERRKSRESALGELVLLKPFVGPFLLFLYFFGETDGNLGVTLVKSPGLGSCLEFAMLDDE